MRFLITLLLFGIIQQPLAQPIPAEKLLKDPYASGMELSPYADYISIFINDEEGRFLSIVENETKIISKIIKFDSKDYVESYQWLDKDTLYMVVNQNGEEKRWVVDVIQSRRGLTARRNMIFADGYLLSSLPNDDENILYAKNKKNGGLALEIYKMPVTELRLENFDKDYLISGLPKSNTFYVYDDLADRLLMLAHEEENESIKVSYMDMQDRIQKFLFRLNNIDYKFDPVGFISDTKMAVLTDKLSDRVALYEFDVLTQSYTRPLYEHSRYDIAKADLSENGQLESVSYYEHGKLSTEYFSDTARKESKLVLNAFPQSQFSIVSEAKHAPQKIILTYASNAPGNYYLFDEQTLVAELLFAARPKLEPYTFAKTETFTFQSVDDKTIEGYLTLPNQSSHNTLLVMPHGGPIGIREYDEFDPTLQYFASRGFAILRVNFRGSTGFGKEFTKGGVGESGRLIESDINLAIDDVYKRHTFDKTCAMGASYGGYSSFMLSIKNPERFSCAIGAFGVYDLPLIFNSSNIAVLEEYRIGWENAFGKLSDAQFDVSPVYLVKDLKVPVLLIGGRQDYQVGFEQTNRMHYVLKKFEKTHEFAFYKNAGHGHSNWWGEWHEHALTYQFLADTLNLPIIDIASSSEEDKKLISSEPLRVAYSYNSDKSIDKDEKRAIKFFKDAADLGNADGLYALGFYYNQGEIVNQDKKLAEQYFYKASEAGSANASKYLAEQFYAGQNSDPDYKRAFEMYELAKKQKYHAGINTLLARSYCFGNGVKQDIEVCIEFLKFKKLKDNSDNVNELTSSSYGLRKSVLSEILNSPLIDADSRMKLLNFLTSEFGIFEYSPKVSAKDYGVVTSVNNKFKYSGNDVVQVSDSIDLGLSFEVSRASKSTTGLVAHWIKTLQDGTEEIIHRTFLYGSGRDNWYIHTRAAGGDQQIRDWQVKIFDLHNRLLYSKKFVVVEKTVAN